MLLPKSIPLVCFCLSLMVIAAGCGPVETPPQMSDSSPIDSTDEDLVDPIAETPAAASPSGPAEEVDLKELLAAVRSDADAATEKYDGKHLKITGVARDMDGEFMNHGYPARLLVATEFLPAYDPQYLKVYVLCLSGDQHPWDVCSVGDAVTVNGVAKVEYGSVRLENSVVTTAEGSPAPSFTVEEFAELLEADVPAAKEKFEEQWITLTGKAVENIREERGNHTLIFYKSDKVMIQAEYSDVGKQPLKAVEPGQEVTIGDVLMVFELDDVATFHFSNPWVKPAK